MGAEEKVKAGAKEAVGKVKEGVGAATDNRDLQAEGKLDQASAEVRQSVEKAKDALK
jgi:uncharacterized protein YjbJ (UPF0337 family)